MQYAAQLLMKSFHAGARIPINGILPLPGCTADVGSRYGFPHSTRRDGSVKKAGGAWHLRIRPCARCLLQCNDQLEFKKHPATGKKRGDSLTPEEYPALSAIIKALTSPGDKVLVQTPVYNCFFSSIRNNGCEIVSNPLIYENETYRIDFDDLEKKVADSKVRLLLLCNPHNPAGRVWSREELVRIGEICLQNHVTVVADEIHCELVFPGYTYTPFASISQEFLMNSVTCISPARRSTWQESRLPTSCPLIPMYARR